MRSLDNENLAKRNAFKQLPFARLTLPLMFAKLSQEVAQLLHTERFELELSKVVYQDDKRDAVRLPTISAEFGLLWGNMNRSRIELKLHGLVPYMAPSWL